MIILIDMDGVITHFEPEIESQLKQNHPNIQIPEQRKIKITDHYQGKESEIVQSIKNSKGFIKNLQPIEGSLEALNYLLNQGHEVFICSSPLTRNKYSFTEKFEWILENLGQEWRKRLILTSDKTRVSGDILIDDYPEVKGSKQPDWEHIIFDQPYNQHITNKKRINWQNFKEILGL